MAHVEKYTIAAVGHMFKHYERAKDDKAEYIKFGNQNIDLSKTNMNYNMATDQKLPQLSFITKRLKEVKVQQRKDVNVMCSGVVTLPQGMDKEERQFFEATFQFLSDRYGKKTAFPLTSTAMRVNRICTSLLCLSLPTKRKIGKRYPRKNS